MSTHVKLEIRNSKVALHRESRFDFRVSNFEFRHHIWGRIVGLATTSLALGSSSLAFAQSCAMCYNTAASAKAAAIQALRSGILILLIPPVLMVGAIMARTLRSRERFDNRPETGEMDRELSPWLERSPLDEASASRRDGVRPAEECASELTPPPGSRAQND